jgi:hypothetical protein
MRKRILILGLGDAICTGIKFISSKLLQSIYPSVKDVCLGKLAIKGWAKELAECFYEININKMADDTCKRAFFCLLPVVGIVESSVLTNVIDHLVANMIRNTIGNGSGLLI